MIKAVIFDMDGVIIDSEPVYMEWLRGFLREHQVTASEEELAGMVGISPQNYQKNLELWWQRLGKPLPERETLYEWFERYCEKKRFSSNDVKNPYAAALFSRLKSQGIRIAVASSSSRKDILKTLKETELLPFVDVVESGAELEESKPNPEIYLRILQRLELTAKECIAVEDSPYGIQAAKGAGIFVAAKKEERFGFSQSGADVKIEDLDQLWEVLEKQKSG